jgi:hypothetical protein
MLVRRRSGVPLGKFSARVGSAADRRRARSQENHLRCERKFESFVDFVPVTGKHGVPLPRTVARVIE